MAKVFIPSVPSRYDPLLERRVPSISLTDAERYGELVQLTDLQNQHSLQHNLSDLRDAMAEFGAGDYLLIAGDVILAAAAIAYACDMHDRVRVLRWDREKRVYEMTEVEL